MKVNFRRVRLSVQCGYSSNLSEKIASNALIWFEQRAHFFKNINVGCKNAFILDEILFGI